MGGVHGGWGALWGIPEHLWDQEKRQVGHRKEASVGHPASFLSSRCAATFSERDHEMRLMTDDVA